MKVLRIINRFNLGGPTHNAAYLSAFLPDEYETILVGGEIDESENSSLHIIHEMGLKPIIISSMKRSINPFLDIQSYREVKKIIQQEKPTIVHTHASKAGLIGRWAAYRCGVPVIVHTYHGHVFHSYFSKWKTFLVKKIERFLATKTSAIVVISELQKKEIALDHKIATEDKFHIIPLGFDLRKFQENQIEKRNEFRKRYLLADDEVAIGIIGRLVPIKNHLFFIQVVQQIITTTTKKVRFFIIGDGESRASIENECNQLAIPFSDKAEDKAILTFTSWIKEIDIANAGLDIITLCSYNEGTPVSLIEAQAANKPIVTTRVGGIENAVIKNKTAFITAINIADFSTKLLQLIEDDTLRTKMGKEGWDFVKEKYHFLRLVKDMDILYQKLVQNHIDEK